MENWYDVIVIHFFAIIMVVAFHAYGMMYADTHFPALKHIYYRLYFAWNQCVIVNVAMPMFVFVSILLYGNYWHLWFLPMLFWCFIVAYFLNKYFVSLQSQVIIACVSFVLSLFFPFFPEILGFQYITRWFCWFYLGIIIYNYKDKLIVGIAKFRLEYIYIYSLFGYYNR